MLKCLFFLILPILCFAQQDSSQLEHETEIGLALNSKSKPFRFLTNTPGDVYQIFKSPFKKQYTTGFVATMIATGLLIPFDQPIADGVKHICRQMHLYSQTDYEVILKYKKARIIRIPRNLNSGLYQLGEGGTSVILAAGLFAYGKLFHDKRSVGVAWDLTETFITMGMSTQIIKRITGRESPFRATADGGIWRPLPGFVEYQTNTSRYDAFPSGHLATMMATVTTLVLNYPNKKWLKPVGYGIIGLTAIAMINTDVHWISDYPLALALGFVAAKITFNRNHRSLNLRT
ncbi:MAG: phosphatase PAP2 family protein [Saprospiraceae bacterium]